MAFKRTGDANKIDQIVDYSKDKEHDVLCPNCKAKLNFAESNGIIRQGSRLIIGKVIVKCSSCGKTVTI